MTNSKSRVYTCPECQRSFSRTNTLAIHKRTHSGEKPFSCVVCGKVFANVGNMKIHMRIHTGEKPFSCSFCGKGFSQHGSLKAHLRIHTKERPFTCSHCTKTFRVQANLKKHLAVHSDECPFSCKICHKSFKLKPDLNRHLKNVHSVEKHNTDSAVYSMTIHEKAAEGFPIQNCGEIEGQNYYNLTSVVLPFDEIKTMPRLESMSKLQTRISGFQDYLSSIECPFLCKICHKSFKLKLDLNQHLKSVHPFEKISADSVVDSIGNHERAAEGFAVRNRSEIEGHNYCNLTSMVLPLDEIKAEPRWESMSEHHARISGFQDYSRPLEDGNLVIPCNMSHLPSESIHSTSCNVSSTLDMETLHSVTGLSIVKIEDVLFVP